MGRFLQTFDFNRRSPRLAVLHAMAGSRFSLRRLDDPGDLVEKPSRDGDSPHEHRGKTAPVSSTKPYPVTVGLAVRRRQSRACRESGETVASIPQGGGDKGKGLPP